MTYQVSDLVRIAKRENNRKRNYLVVNPLQGKHIPAAPGRTLQLFDALADKIKGRYSGERLLLVGFAETATAIGARVAISLGTKYIQTTRERIPGAEYLFFSEEHSHATEQKLVKDDIESVISEIDRIIFIEDEITTGKTILNIVSILKTLSDCSVKFSAASLLNGMTQEYMEQYRLREIDLFYLVKTDHSKFGEIAAGYPEDGCCLDCTEEGNQKIREWKIPGWMDARRLVDAASYEKACDDFRNQILERIGDRSGQKILVLGTEEFMYPAVYVGEKLELSGNDVRCHATTRSPIAVSKSEEYPLHTRYEIKSVYDQNRKNYLYDIDTYDEVLIMTDAQNPEREGLVSLINAISGKNGKITLVRWCDR